MRKILVIDDDENVLDTTSTWLELKGYQVFSATDGTQGVKVAFNEIPDLVLCDITMPDLDGYQVFEILQNNEKTVHIPFIFLSAKSEKADLRKGMQMGADDYITKPFAIDEVLKAIETRIKKRERILQISEDKFNALISNPELGIFITQERQIVNVNNKFAKITGYPVEYLQKIPFSDLIVEKEKLEELIGRCINGIQESFHDNFMLITKLKEKKKIRIYCRTTIIQGQTHLVGNITPSHPDLETYITSEADQKEIEKIIQLIAKNANFQLAQNKKEAHAAFNEEVAGKIMAEKFTRREKEILELICEGLSTRAIADKLFISTRTVESHRANLFNKTNTNTISQLIVFALRNKIVEL